MAGQARARSSRDKGCISVHIAESSGISELLHGCCDTNASQPLLSLVLWLRSVWSVLMLGMGGVMVAHSNSGCGKVK